MKPRQASRPLRRLLLVLPRLPLGSRDAGLRRLISQLSSVWALDLVCAGPSLLEQGFVRSLSSGARLLASPAADELSARCRQAVTRQDYAALIVVDDPAVTRGCVPELRRFARTPIVLVLLGRVAGAERPVAALSGDGFPAPRGERESLERQSCAAAEIWSFGAGRDRSEGAFYERRRIERAWMSRRLRSLGGARPERALTSIIIPCFNGLRYTRECLEAVRRHTPERHEIIVVDNGSSDGTGPYAHRVHGARVIRNDENLGFAKAVNQGIEAARGRYLVWLNNDVVVTPRWLERMIACAARAPWIAAVGPCTDVTVGFQRVTAPAFRTPRSLAVFSEAWALRHGDSAEGVHRLTGFCLLLKREAVRRVGLLDERFGVGTYEEFDYCLRLRQAGYDLAVARGVFVRHHGHKTFGDFRAMAERARLNRDVFLDKWCRQALSFLDDVNSEAASAGTD